VNRLRTSPSRLRALLLAAAGGLLLAYAAASLSILTLSADRVLHRAWRGYYVLSLVRGPDNEELSHQLEGRSGIAAVISRYTATEAVNTFSGQAVIPVNRLRERLDDLDPRFDPYLRSVQRLFLGPSAGGGRELFYLRSDLSPLALAVRLFRQPQLSAGSFRLLDLDLAARGLQLLLFAAFSGVLVAMQPRDRRRLIAGLGLLPWAAVVALGELPQLLFFFLVYPGCVRLAGAAHDYLKERLYFPRRSWASVLAGEARAHRAASVRAALFPGLLAAAALVLLGREGRPLSGAFVALGCELLLLPLLYLLLALDLTGGAHPPFQPLRLLHAPARRVLASWTTQPGGSGLTRGALPGMLLVALALLAYPAGWMQKRAVGPLMYLPRGESGPGDEELSWSNLRALAVSSAQDALPNLASYLSHCAFQEALAFGRPYGFPAMDERIRVSIYRHSAAGPAILRGERVVRQFKEAWLWETLASSPAQSVGRLLADQAVAAPVQAVRDTAALRLKGVGVEALLVVLFLGAFLLAGHHDLTGYALYGTTTLAPRRQPHGLWETPEPFPAVEYIPATTRNSPTRSPSAMPRSLPRP
jgi:hypothetical protein